MDGLLLVHPEHVLVKSCKEAFPDLERILKDEAVKYIQSKLPVYALCHTGYPDFLPRVNLISHIGSTSPVGLCLFDQGFTFAARMIAKDLRRYGIGSAVIGGLYHGACCKIMEQRLKDEGVFALRDKRLTDYQFLDISASAML